MAGGSGLIGRRRRSRAEQRAEERHELETMELRARIAQQWTQARAENRAARRAADVPPTIGSGPSNFQRAQVPYGVDLAAAWGWRFLVICAAGLVVLYLVKLFVVVVLPLVVALLLAALTAPLVPRLQRLGLPRALSAVTVVVVLVAGVGTVITFVGTSIADGFVDLNEQVANGLGEFRVWLREGPVGVTDSQIDNLLSEGQQQLASFGEDLVGRATEVGAALGNIVAAFFIALFALFFFLYDGHRIWSWVVRLFPRAGRAQADSSGRVAWSSLTQFVRATVVVAGVDAFFIALGAAVLGVPFVGAIAVLVFLGGFVPLVGATVSGGVAVLVALVAQGPVVALLMLAVVVGVQQIEAQVLQPFLLGRFVSVHPLAVIVVIAMGLLVAGVAGALVAVPLAASVNAVVQHLAQETDVGEDPVEAVDEDLATEEP